jgi:hypothetical protein
MRAAHRWRWMAASGHGMAVTWGGEAEHELGDHGRDRSDGRAPEQCRVCRRSNGGAEPKPAWHGTTVIGE